MGQTDSLELTTPNAIGEFEPKVLERLFETLEPTILHQITLTDTNGDEPGCICASSEEDPGTLPEYGCRILQLPHGAFENIVRPVQVLRLSGLYFHWESLAYHGLVELRLELPKTRPCYVSMTQLHRVFLSSPELATLHIGLQIMDDQWAQRNVAPAHLKDLEVLNTGNLFLMANDQLEILFRLFTPGQKALQLTIGLRGNQILSNPDSKTTRFLKRAKVTKLCLIGIHKNMVIDELLPLMPQLQVLVLNGYNETVPTGPLISTSQRLSLSTPSITDTLYLQEGRFDLESLCLLAGIISPRAIVFWRTEVCRDTTTLENLMDIDDAESEDDTVLRKDDVSAALSEFCPIIRHVAYHQESPIRSWGRQS